jgi:hypothetical protein
VVLHLFSEKPKLAFLFVCVRGFFFCLFFVYLKQVSLIAQAGIKLMILLPQHPHCWALQVCATIPGLAFKYFKYVAL